MSRGVFTFAAVFLCGFFVLHGVARAANSDIVINEIGAYESSDHEWIEIWNKGSEPVDLSEWKFWENSTNHGLSAGAADSMVEPGEYAVISQNAGNFVLDYPGFGGTIFDSSWGSLNESGEEIGLKDADGNFVEKFIYITAPDFSLERKNPFLTAYDETNWQQHASGNSTGAINSNYSIDEIVPIDLPTSTPPEVPSTSTPPEEPGDPDADIYASWSQIRINEFVSDPAAGNEWAEFFNWSTSSVNLSGGLICDSRDTTSTCKNTVGTIEPYSWFYIDLASESFLNNDGDSVIFKNPTGVPIDRIDYSGSLIAEKGQALARRQDGIDTDSPADWAITTVPTPATPNSIIAPVSKSGGGGGGSAAPTTVTAIKQIIETPEPIVSVTSSPVRLNELYPNPPGSDSYDEFIEIYNDSDGEVDLSGWQIGDMSKRYSLSGKVIGRQILFFKRQATGIALNNSSKEEVKLYSSSGDIIDFLSYDVAPEGESYIRDDEGSWRWTNEPTPGAANKAAAPEQGQIIWNVKIPSTADVGEMIIFDAEDSADKRGGNLVFQWDFGDGFSAIGGETEHAFATSGEYVVIVSATSTSGSLGRKKYAISIGAGLSQHADSVVISEICPNPEDNEQKEYIEMYNDGDKAIYLSGWSVKTKNGKQYEFGDSTVIAPGSYLVFYRPVLKFALNNQGDQIALINRDKQTVDLAKFGKGDKGSCYGLFNGEWQWLETQTPGAENSGLLNESEKRKIPAVKSLVNKAPFKSMSIAEARDETANSAVIVQGIVSVLPGIFSSQYFYIVGQDGGIQVYSFKKSFPKMELGDVIEVIGTISEPGGVKRIKTTPGSIKVLRHESSPIPYETEIENIQENNLGGLVKVSGEITESKSNYFYLDNGSAEVKVLIKKNVKVDRKNFKIGSWIKVSGVLEGNIDQFDLWPREAGDIEIDESKIAGSSQNVDALPAGGSKEMAEKYLTATAGGLTALFVGLLARARGLVLISFFRKSASLAINLFKRG